MLQLFLLVLRTPLSSLSEVCENLDLMKKSSVNGIKGKTLALSCIWVRRILERGTVNYYGIHLDVLIPKGWSFYVVVRYSEVV